MTVLPDKLNASVYVGSDSLHLHAYTIMSEVVLAGLVTSKSNALQLLVTLTKSNNGSYLNSYFWKFVASYFSSYYKLKPLHDHSNMLACQK